MSHSHRNKGCSCGSSDHDCDCGCSCNCGCCGGGGRGFQRQYMTHKEEYAMLEEYQQELKLELEAVEERMKELKGKK